MSAVDSDRAVETAALVEWRDGEASKAFASGAEPFMHLPDAWYDDAHYGCGGGHVSRTILTGDSGDRCLACRRPVVIIPPMTETEFAKICVRISKGADVGK